MERAAPPASVQLTVTATVLTFVTGELSVIVVVRVKLTPPVVTAAAEAEK